MRGVRASVVLLLLGWGCGDDSGSTYVATVGGPEDTAHNGDGGAGFAAEGDHDGDGGSAITDGGAGPSVNYWTRDDAGAPTAPSASPTNVVLFSDPKGDAEPWPGMLRYPLDLLAVRVETVGDELIVRYRFSRTLAEHFAFPGIDGKRTAGAPCELFLDVDNDPTTGIRPTWADESDWADELRGYEVELDVLLIYSFKSKADGSEGHGGGDVVIDEHDYDITGYYANYWFMDETADQSLGPNGADAGFGFPDTEDLTVIDGDVVELHVPLAWLGVEAGDVLRLMYRENDQGAASGVGYSQNARLRVR